MDRSIDRPSINICRVPCYLPLGNILGWLRETKPVGYPPWLLSWSPLHGTYWVVSCMSNFEWQFMISYWKMSLRYKSDTPVCWLAWSLPASQCFSRHGLWPVYNESRDAWENKQTTKKLHRLLASLDLLDQNLCSRFWSQHFSLE